MVRLFQYEGYKVSIAPEALILLPFKKIWDRDKSKDKHVAMQELGYIYFMEDPRSDYQYLIDKEMRSLEVIKGEGFPNKWEPDDDIKRAMEFYASFKPMSAALLEDTRSAIDKLRETLRTINLNERDDKNKPIYTLNTITQTIKQIPALVKELDEAEKCLYRDIMSENKARGSQTKALYEDEV